MRFMKKFKCFINTTNMFKNFFKFLIQDVKAKFGVIDFFVFLICLTLFIAYNSIVHENVMRLAVFLNNNFNNSFILKFITCLFLLCVILRLISVFIKRRVPKKILLFSIYLMPFYVYFRWYNKCIEWIYILEGYFTYYDIIGVISAAIIILYFVEIFNSSIIRTKIICNEDTLLCDDAITNIKEDILNRTSFVKGFVNLIKNCNPKKSAYSVALIAPWGNGKTSFIKLFTEELKQQSNYKIIYFSPWHFSEKKDIMTAFFDQLSKYIFINDSELFKLISDYTNLLIGETKTTLILNLFKNKYQPYELYEKISSKLSERTERIVFIIDDIDRLDGKEILEVFKIIRGSANFPNIIFISAFDKDYVINSIKSIQVAVNDRFIEKFFQTEYYLPLYSQDIIKEYILSQAKEFLTKDDFEDFKERYIEYGGLYQKKRPYEDFIKNIRDTKRWINTIKIEYKLLKEEIIISNLADLILFKLYFPSIYNFFSNEYKSFLYIEGDHYIFWEEGIGNNDDYFEILNYKKRNFWECEKVKDLSNSNKERLCNIFNRLLPKNGYSPRNKAFNDPFFTPRYFYGILQNTDIPHKDFVKYIKMNYEEMKELMSPMYVMQRSQSLLKHWRHYNPIDDNERVNMLKMIFYVCSICDSLFCSQEVLYNIINNFNKSKNEIAQILHNVMLENEASYYVCLLVKEINKNIFDWSKYLSLEEFVNIQLENIKQAFNKDLSIEDIFRFFWTTKKEIYFKEGGSTLSKYINNPKAVEIFKEGIISNPQKFLYKLIGSESSPMSEQKEWKPYDILYEAWTNWGDFEKFIKEIPLSKEHTKEHIEYLDFFDKFKINNYIAVKYNFKYCLKN